MNTIASTKPEIIVPFIDNKVHVYLICWFKLCLMINEDWYLIYRGINKIVCGICGEFKFISKILIMKSSIIYGFYILKGK